MKILRIIYEWPPPWDGLAPAPYEMTQAQLKLGHTFDIFCGRWPFSGKIETLPNVLHHLFPREIVPGTLLLTSAPAMFIYYLYYRTKNKPDIIHAHGHFGAWLYLYRYFLMKFFPKAGELKIPLIGHFHNTVKGRWVISQEQKKNIKFYSKYLAWPMALLSDQYLIKVASYCIFVSHGTRDQAIKYYKADPAKCIVVETGVNTDLFCLVGFEEKDKARKELHLNPEDHIILNHGAMVERKNVHLLIECLNFLPPEYKLLLLGPGDDKYIDRLNDMVVQFKLEKRVIRIGYTPYPQVPIAFQVSDLFVLPSSFEGLPKVVMQSLSCGVPALASGFRVNEEIDGLYYISELKAETIAQEIKDVLSKHVRVDIPKVHRLYSWDVKAGQVEEIYGKVIQKN